MPLNLLPVLIAGGAYLAFSGGRKKRRRKPSSGQTALPPANGSSRGEVFSGDNPPDLIVVQPGERFSVSFPESGGTGYGWSLSASPVDNSVELISTEVDKVQGDAVGGHSESRVFVLEAKKAGRGSLVFHLQAPWLEGKQPPAETVEIQTRIS